MPTLPTLITPTFILINSFLNKLSGAAIISGDGGGEGTAVEDFLVHLAGSREGIVSRDELNKSDAARLAGGPVFEDGDAGDLSEGGEESMEIRVG